MIGGNGKELRLPAVSPGRRIINPSPFLFRDNAFRVDNDSAGRGIRTRAFEAPFVVSLELDFSMVHFGYLNGHSVVSLCSPARFFRPVQVLPGRRPTSLLPCFSTRHTQSRYGR